MSENRDDFSEKTKRILAGRTGCKCSNPFCRVTTIGPQQGSDGTVNIGGAAHIYAASRGGKRYNPNMTSEERKSYENGIWLCRTHAALIDRDEKYFTVEMLQKWKEYAECEARRELIGEETIKKCKFRMRIFFDDLRECQKSITVLKKKRGISVPQTLLPIQGNWEQYLEKISDSIGKELLAELYKILCEIEEFKLAMLEIQSKSRSLRTADTNSVKYCRRYDIFIERMDEWLTEDFLEIIGIFAELS